MTDGGTRVPCVVSWPGVIRQGRVVKDIIDFSDFLPTICQAAGVRIAADLVIDGQSFLPQLEGKPGTPRESIYLWYSRSGSAKKAEVFARSRRYKLYDDGRFFDVGEDRLERSPPDDAALSREARAAKAALQTRLDAFEDVTRSGEE